MTPPRRQRVMSPQMRAALGLPATDAAPASEPVTEKLPAPGSAGGNPLAEVQLANVQLANVQLANVQRANVQRANVQPANAQLANAQRADVPPEAIVPIRPALAITLRVQRRLAIRTMSVLLGGLVLGPLLLAMLPGLALPRVGGLPIVWIVLGVLAYPALLVLAHHHRRAVDRLEGELAKRDNRA